MADVRSYTSGVPTAAVFADLGALIPGGTPLVVDTATGDGYVLIGGVVTRVARPSVGTGTISGSTGSIDNAILRANGTGGSTIQGQTSGGPILNDDGSVVNAKQPAFLAYNSASDLNVTGAGTAYTIICNTEVYDQASNYDNTTGIFTAAVAGVHLFCGTVALTGITAANDGSGLTLITTGRSIVLADFEVPNFAMTVCGLQGSTMTYMNVGDTAKLSVASVGEAGDVVDVVGGGSPYNTYFSGCLLA